MQTQQAVPMAKTRSFFGSLVRIVAALVVVAVLVVGTLIGLGVFAVREGLSTMSKTVEILGRMKDIDNARPSPAGETALRTQADRMANALAAMATPDKLAEACVDRISYRDGEVVVSLTLAAEFEGKAPRFEIKSPETKVLPFDTTTEGTSMHRLKLGDPGPLTLAIKVWIGDAYAGRFVALKGRDMDFKARRAK